MRKSLLKTLVATAVVGTTLAITSVAAFAAEVGAWSATASTKAPTAGENLFDNEYATATWYDGQIFKTSSVSDKERAIGSHTYVAKALAIQSDAGSSKGVQIDINEMKAVNKRPIVTVTAKQDVTVVIDNKIGSGDNKGSFIATNLKATGEKAATADSYTLLPNSTGSSIWDSTTLSVKAGDSITFGGVGNNAVIAGVYVLTGDAPLTETTYPTNAGSVVVKGTDAYVIGSVSDIDKKDSVTITIGDKTFTTDTVYKSVEVDGTTIAKEDTDGKVYYYAVKVTGLASDLDATNVKTFTLA